ncbi:MAG: hypothetical protein ACLGHY_12465, partial [Gammaproteobacteria bacterium]
MVILIAVVLAVLAFYLWNRDRVLQSSTPYDAPVLPSTGSGSGYGPDAGAARQGEGGDAGRQAGGSAAGAQSRAGAAGGLQRGATEGAAPPGAATPAGSGP